MLKIEGQCGEPFETNEKRFYVPGVTLKANCPKCGAECERDLGGNYLSYPEYNSPIEIDLFCNEECDPDGGGFVAGKIMLKLSVEIVPKKKR